MSHQKYKEYRKAVRHWAKKVDITFDLNDIETPEDIQLAFATDAAYEIITIDETAFLSMAARHQRKTLNLIGRESARLAALMLQALVEFDALSEPEKPQLH